MHNFIRAAEVYDQLIQKYPDVEEYTLSLIHSLINAGAIHDANHVISKQNSDIVSQNILVATIHVNLENEDLDACRSLLNDVVYGDPITLVTEALVCYKEGNVEDALEKFLEVFDMIEFDPCLMYNIALCYYMLKNFVSALDYIDRIIAAGLEKYPEFKSTHDTAVIVHGNKEIALQESYLIEAYNLKAAIEFSSKNLVDCKRTLASMPPREEECLDPVSLHNYALFDLEKDTQSSFEKFRFLLANPPFPPVTFQNLLLLYCQHGFSDMASDFIANNLQLSSDLVDEDLIQYTRSLSIVDQEEALKQLESLTVDYTETIDSLNNELNKHIDNGNEEMITTVSEKVDGKIFMLLSIVMAHAHIYWKQKDYVAAEQVLRNAPNICTDSNSWKLNMAHVLFIQQGLKIKECITYYQSIVDAETKDSILRVSPVVLANLCVAYIVSNENEKAEALIKQVEIAERKSFTTNEDWVETWNQHSCIINLVIGTLYCEKSNFDPYATKLNLDTWYYVKRCLLALADKVAKQMLVPSHSLKDMVTVFLNDILSSISNSEQLDSDNESFPKIVDEAKRLRAEFLLLNQLY
jgi:tetratricopeptide repeat protein 30